MTAERGSKVEFCSQADWGWPKEKTGMPAIHWYDLQGIMRLDGDRRAVLTLEQHGFSGRFDGFLVQLVSKTKGELSRKYFRFDDYIVGVGAFVDIQIGWHWRIGSPRVSELQCYSQAVMAWVSEWR